MRITFDSFAAPAQIGELHRLVREEGLEGPERADALVRHLTGKYPHDLLQEEAAKLIVVWTEDFPLETLYEVMADALRSNV